MSLVIHDLNLTYTNGVKALHHIDLEIGSGMFGLLGPNGAGKSTLMRTLATLQIPDSGSIKFNDIDVINNPFDLRKQLGYLPQEFGVYPQKSAWSMLNYLAVLKGMVQKKSREYRVMEVLELTHLLEVKHRFVNDFSGGMKQRFGIAQVLLNQPRLIIVDEPTSGLDPAERKHFLNLLRGLGADRTIIFSTHIVDDIMGLCRELAILSQGKIKEKGNIKMLIDDLEGCIWTTVLHDSEEISGLSYVISSAYSDDYRLQARVYGKIQPGDSFTPVKPSLEDVYFLAQQKT